MKTWILESGEEEWARGESRQSAIENAIASRETARCDGKTLKVDFETIIERLEYGSGNGGLDLYEST